MARKHISASPSSRQQAFSSQQDAAGSDDEEAHNSFPTHSQGHLNLPQDMLKKTKERTQQKRDELSKKHDTSVSIVEKDIISFLDSDRAEGSRYRLDQITKLLGLVKKRQEIEVKILGHTKALDEFYGAARNEMGATLKGRIKDLSKDKEANSTAAP